MSLAKLVRGHGPDLVLVHGWGFDARVWEPLADLLADRHTLHLVDLPGYGRSRHLAFPAFPELLDELRTSSPAGATLAGWSLGGQLAIACAAAHAGHFGRLVLFATTPSFVARDGWPHGVAPVLLDGFRRSLDSEAAGLLKRFGALLNQGDAHARELTRRLGKLYDAQIPTVAALRQGLDLLLQIDLRELLPRLALPTLVIHGDADPLMPLAGAAAMVARLPAARLEHITGAAHLPFAAEARLCAELLAEFTAAGAACRY